MPALIDDPLSPPNYRQSGLPPFLQQNSPLPSSITPNTVTLRDGTITTLIPFSSVSQVPPGLIKCLCDLLNREIEAGDTYPMLDPIPPEKFGPYWFANFAVVALKGELEEVTGLLKGEGREREVKWDEVVFGTHYIKPNYPGRSSHICNAGFLVHESARGKGIGRVLGEGYIKIAPLLGYVYSVFNLVYESNTASCRLWDSLGFDRIGRVPGCGQLKGYDKLIDAIQYGRHLVPEGEAAGKVAAKDVQQGQEPESLQADKTASGISAKTEVNPEVLL